MCLSKAVKFFSKLVSHLQHALMLLASVSLMSCAQADIQSDAFLLKQVSEGIYVHQGAHLDIDTGYQGDICNLSVVVGSKGVAVIDTGGSLLVGRQLHHAIKKITPLPILYVINTHVHPDHVYGNAAFLANNDVKALQPQFVGHTKLADAMQIREEAYQNLNAKYLGAAAHGSVIVKPTLPISAPTTLDLGDRTLAITPHNNAHTNTDISIIDNKTNTLFTGDLLFIERTPVIEGDIKGLIATLESFKKANVSQVVPGHGPVAKDWKTAIDNELRYLNVLLSDIRSAIAKGQSMEATMDSAASSEKNKWLLFDIANRRNVNTLYPALEWE